MDSVLLIIRLLSGLIDFPIVLDHGAAKTAPDGESITFEKVKTRKDKRNAYPSALPSIP